MLRLRQGGPNLGQPEAPLTAVNSAAPLSSRLSGIRYNPCTCFPVEAVCHQTREEMAAVHSSRACIDLPPFQPGNRQRPMPQNLCELLYTYLNPPVKRRSCDLHALELG